MNDDELCKLLKGSSGNGGVLVASSSPPVRPEQPNKPKQFGNKCIILRKLFTITTMKVYPDGQIYVNESHSWLDKDQSIHKPKKKKKAKTITQSKIKTAEVL